MFNDKDTHVDVKCKEFGLHEKRQYLPDVAKRLRERGLCHGCDFWQGKVDLRTDAQEASRLVRTPDHEHFHIGPSASNASRGFGGRAFIVEFFDGRKVETNNLWSQGTIPAHFRERLPPNANLRSKS